MATKQQIIDYLTANPNLSDAQLVAYMEQNGISPSQLAEASGAPVGQISAQIAATVPIGQAVLLGDTWVQANYQIIGSGEDQQIGGIESVSVYKTTGGINDKLAVGTDVKNYTPEGEYVNTSKTKKDLSFLGGIGEALKDPFVQAALLGIAGGAGLFGGAGALGGGATTALTAAEAAGLGLTAAEAASLGLSAAEFAAASAAATSGGLLTGGASATAGMSAAELAAYDLALGGAGGTAGATSLANALATGANVGTLTNLTGGSGLLTGAEAGITAQSVAEKLAADAATQFELTNAGASALTNTGVKTAAELAAERLAAEELAKKTAADALTKTVVTTGAKTAAELAAEKALADAALTKKIADAAGLITGGFKTVGGLLQTEEDKAAARTAATNINTATQAAVAGSQFRPVGMTTRFGTSQYKYDPVTGQMTSAGYQLTPEAKAQQDRFATMANYSLTQAENAQSQFAPLQTGAANLFGLGNQYISQSPQDVAQRYINQQMQLLQPSREMELANLQNRLQQQGRAGLSVAQGGTLGATTPELQALYNARAQQELQLAANAQREGQQNTLFGANLLGQGSQALGQYFGGQVQAYQPYQAAMGQVQNLESLGQQPLQMGASLGQQASTAGFNAGRLGLQGAGTAAELTTGKAATTNPYASLFAGIDPTFATGIAKQIFGV